MQDRVMEWSKEEVQFLLKNLNSMSLEDIAESLNRTTTSVAGKIQRMKRKAKNKGLYEIKYVDGDEFYLNYDFIQSGLRLSGYQPSKGS